MISASRLFANRPALFSAKGIVSRLLPVAAIAVSIHAGSLYAQKEPGTQKEGDWIDARWNQTDLGNFHASLVTLPGGTIAKGLSVRVGRNSEGAVAYDTATATLRAGWVGGFLTFDAARYGLLRNPKPAAEPSLLLPASKASIVKWRGTHVNGPRVVLDYEVNGIGVLETPGMETAGGSTWFTRTIQLRDGTRDVSWRVIDANAAGIRVTNLNELSIATVLVNKRQVTFVAAGAELRRVESGLEFSVRGTRPARLFISQKAEKELADVMAALSQVPPVEDLLPLAKAGNPRWKPLQTRGQRGFGSDAFVIDTLTVPYENPWKALFFTSGVDFLPTGEAAVCTIHGDVWLVSGVDDKLERLTWRRFATGLFQPLGLRVRDAKIYVLGRDQITLLHDENSDGEADFYENFFNGIHTSTGGHDYVTSLETDTNGNFYYVDPRGAHRVKADGSTLETIAGGWRNPNGMGVSPDGKIVTVAPQQGEWTPSSCISEARTSGWYGYGGPRITGDRPLGYDPQLCWIPHSVDNSGGSQLWVTSDRWGPLKGGLLHFSYGRCAQMLVLRGVVDGVAQAAVAPLPGRFLSGIMRGAFNPGDGQLYLVGSTGWQTAAARDGCLQRVRYTGAPILVPIEAHAHTNGLRLTFPTELNKAAAEDAGSFGYTHWNYRYAAQYGSKDWSPSNPSKEGHDALEVKSARLLPDQKTVFIEIAGLVPVMQYELKYSLSTAKGRPMRSFIAGTINKLGPRFGGSTLNP
jgi:hypothetical protein